MLRRRQPDEPVEQRPSARPHPEPHGGPHGGPHTEPRTEQHAGPHPGQHPSGHPGVHPAVRTSLALLAALGAGTAVVQAATAVAAHDEWATAPPTGGLVLELPGRAPHGDQLALPDDTLADLAPGDVRTVTVRVTNSSGDRQSVAPHHRWLVDGAGGTGEPAGFVEPPRVDVAGLPHVLEPGASALVTVTVATPTQWGTDNLGRTAQLVVRFVGTHV